MDDGGSSLLYYWAVIQGTFSIPDWKNVVYGWRIFLPATLAAYLLGAVPFGLILTRIAGIEDIRKTGSGNIGATNVLRTGSKRLAATTLVLDAGKGAAAVIAARLWLGPDVAFFAAIAVVLGHMFPVWLGFRGGKGVATMLGVLLALSWPAGLATIASWLAVAFVTRYSSLAALISIASAPAWCWLMGEPQAAGAAAILAVLVWIRHAGNIRRLLRGEETKIRLSRKSAAPAGR